MTGELVVVSKHEELVSLDAWAILPLLTFNAGDFARFPGVTILKPDTVAASAAPLGGEP